MGGLSDNGTIHVTRRLLAMQDVHLNTPDNIVAWLKLIALADSEGRISKADIGPRPLARLMRWHGTQGVRFFNRLIADGRLVEDVHGYVIANYGTYQKVVYATQPATSIGDLVPDGPATSPDVEPAAPELELVQQEFELPTAEYPQSFESVWAAYPKRDGSNPKKLAYKRWSQRRKAGVPEADLLKATTSYGEWCAATGKVRSENVMQAATFFGPNERWKEWLNKEPPPTSPTPIQSRSRLDVYH